MPPYQPNKSKAQQRMMFALARKGEVSMADAKGRARASKGEDLPEHVEKKAGLDINAVLCKLAGIPDFNSPEPPSPSVPDYSTPSLDKKMKLPAPPPLKGQDGPNDTAAEHKAKGALKGAPPLPKDFTWPPHKKADFMTPMKPPAAAGDQASGPDVNNPVFPTNSYAPNVPPGPSGPPVTPPAAPAPFASASTSGSNMGAPASVGQGTSQPAKARTFSPGNFSAQT